MTPRWWARVREAFRPRKQERVLPELWAMTDDRAAAEANLKWSWLGWL